MKYRLLQTLFSVKPTGEDMLFTDESFMVHQSNVVYEAGSLYTWNPETKHMVSLEDEQQAIRVDEETPDPTMWQPYVEQPPRTVGQAYTVHAPDGKEIVGTLEQVFGIARITSVVQNEEDVEVIYDGQTDIDWNTQKSMTMFGERLYLDEDQRVWREDEIVFSQVVE